MCVAIFGCMFSTNLNDFVVGVYNKVRRGTELGVYVDWSAGTTFTKFGVAAKHKVDKVSQMQVAVDNSSHLKLGYTNEVSPGKQFSLSSN